MNRTKIAVIGGGPAGLAAAIEAKKAGEDSILVLERDRCPRHHGDEYRDGGGRQQRQDRNVPEP